MGREGSNSFARDRGAERARIASPSGARTGYRCHALSSGSAVPAAILFVMVFFPSVYRERLGRALLWWLAFLACAWTTSCTPGLAGTRPTSSADDKHPETTGLVTRAGTGSGSLAAVPIPIHLAADPTPAATNGLLPHAVGGIEAGMEGRVGNWLSAWWAAAAAAGGTGALGAAGRHNRRRRRRGGSGRQQHGGRASRGVAMEAAGAAATLQDPTVTDAFQLSQLEGGTSVAWLTGFTPIQMQAVTTVAGTPSPDSRSRVCSAGSRTASTAPPLSDTQSLSSEPWADESSSSRQPQQQQQLQQEQLNERQLSEQTSLTSSGTQSETEYEEEEGPNQRQAWPATPEFTPPGSPRARVRYPAGQVAWSHWWVPGQQTMSPMAHAAPMPMAPVAFALQPMPQAAATAAASAVATPMALGPLQQLQHPQQFPQTWQPLQPQPQQMPHAAATSQSSSSSPREDDAQAAAQVQVQAPVPQQQRPQSQFDALAWWSAAGADKVLSLLAQPDVGQRRDLITWIAGVAWQMAVRRHGCRILQKALEVADANLQIALAEPLQGHVVEAMRSPHGNHVLQKCIVLLPPERIQFVLAELQGHGADAARHRFGCRILERLLEHCPSSLTEPLMDEVVAKTEELCRHEFGNYVLQHVLEHGTASHRQKIVNALAPTASRLAKHRVASNVVERALLYCDAEDRRRLSNAISGDARDFTNLSRCYYGSFVARQLGRTEAASA